MAVLEMNMPQDLKQNPQLPCFSIMSSDSISENSHFSFQGDLKVIKAHSELSSILKEKKHCCFIRLNKV